MLALKKTGGKDGKLFVMWNAYEKNEDHGDKDPQNEWCWHCCHPDGTHKSYEEVVADTAKWMMSEECEKAGFPRAISEREARARAEANFLQQPYWRKHEAQ